jgi:cytochrome c-type biogenesis protein CcmH
VRSARPGRGRTRRGAILGSRPLWALLAVTGAVALAVGSVHPAGAGAARRISALDSVIKCPSCTDISIAQSSAPDAVTLRHDVAARVRAGESDAEIEAWVEGIYGPGVLLQPPASGVDLLVWVVPLAVTGAAVAGLALLFWRRRSSTPLRAVEDDDAAVDDDAIVAAALAARSGDGVR